MTRQPGLGEGEHQRDADMAAAADHGQVGCPDRRSSRRGCLGTGKIQLTTPMVSMAARRPVGGKRLISHLRVRSANGKPVLRAQSSLRRLRQLVRYRPNSHMGARLPGGRPLKLAAADRSRPPSLGTSALERQVPCRAIGRVDDLHRKNDLARNRLAAQVPNSGLRRDGAHRHGVEVRRGQHPAELRSPRSPRELRSRRPPAADRDCPSRPRAHPARPAPWNRWRTRLRRRPVAYRPRPQRQRARRRVGSRRVATVGP